LYGGIVHGSKHQFLEIGCNNTIVSSCAAGGAEAAIIKTELQLMHTDHPGERVHEI